MICECNATSADTICITIKQRRHIHQTAAQYCKTTDMQELEMHIINRTGTTAVRGRMAPAPPFRAFTRRDETTRPRSSAPTDPVPMCGAPSGGSSHALTCTTDATIASRGAMLLDLTSTPHATLASRSAVLLDPTVNDQK